jgi:dihydroorotate dehydrogenase
MYGWLLRPLLFRLPAELAHNLAIWLLALLARVPLALAWLDRAFGARDPVLRVQALGFDLSTPVGLAAGLDKNAEAYEALGALGFGFVEVGTLTPKAQPGSPRPRLFRLPADRALINRMGFNNCGVEDARQRLTRPRHGLIVGANIGKNKNTANERAPDDYVAATRRLAPHVDYLVVNVSSPNTPALRALQAIDQLRPLLSAVKSALAETRATHAIPLLVKISPDLADTEIDAISDLAIELELDGIIATNTTLSRAGLHSDAERVESCGEGGLSGAPLAERSLAVLRRLRARAGSRLVLISVGGIQNAEDAWQRIEAGATLVQVYTAFVYEGPSLVGRINAGLAERTRQAGLSHIGDAIGRAHG